MWKVDRGRIRWIDSAKGIIICLMVFGHAERAVMASSTMEYPLLLCIDKIIYSFHMPVMFFLSGLLFFNLELKDRRKCVYDVLKCVMGLYVPYLIAVYGYWFIKYFIYSGNETVGINDLLVLWFTPRWNLWFLMALLLVKLSVLAIRLFTCKIEIIAGIFFVYYIGFLILEPKSQWAEYLTYGVFYAFGMYTINKNISKKSLVLFTIGSLSATLLLWNTNLYRLCILFAGLSASGVFYLSRLLLDKVSAVFKIFGKYSLEIYICHFMGISVTVRILQSIGVSNPYVLCGLVTLFCLCYPLIVVFLYVYIQPFKWIRYLFHPYELIRNKVSDV